MKKELPLGESRYDTFNSHRNLHSILMTDGDDSVSWYYTSFIQLNSSKKLHTGLSFDFSIDSVYQPSLFKRCPLVDCYVVPYDMVPDNDIIRFCLDSIDKGYYVCVTASQFYISQYYHYQKEYRFHDLFIYGYDTGERKLLVRDFFSAKQVDAMVDFDEFIQSYEEGKTFPFYTNGVYLIKKTDKFNWRFDIDNYRYNLTAYLKCEPVALYHYSYDAKHDYGYIDRSNYYFGLDCCKTLEQMVQEALEFGCYINVIPFHIYERHKLILLDSVKYITERRYIDERHAGKMMERFTELYKRANNILTRVLKYEMNGDLGILKRLPASLRELAQHESEAISELVAILENKVLRVKRGEHGNKWVENRNLSYLDLYHEERRYIKKVFFGREVAVYSNRGADQGEMSVIIDGGEAERVALYSETEETGRCVFRSPGLSDGCHILTIEPEGTDREINVSKIEASDISDFGSASAGEFEFAGVDTETKGSWRGRYGSAGYDIVNHETKVPGDVFLMYRYYSNWRNNETYEEHSGREEALEGHEGDRRIAADIYTLVSLSADITVTGEHAKTVSLYFCDYQRRGYKQRVTVMDRSSSEVVFSEVLTNLSEGKYVRFRMKGSFVVTVRNVSEQPETNATLSAVFFD